MKPAEQPNYSLWQLIRDIWELLGSHRRRFLVATFLRATSELSWLYPAIAISQFVNFLTVYSPGSDLTPLLSIAVTWIFVSVYHYAAKEGSRYLLFNLSERAALDAQLKTLKHMFRLDLSWHEQENTGNKVKRIQRGGAAIDDILRMWIETYVEAMIQFVGALVILATFDLSIAVFFLSFLVSYFVLSYYLTKHAIEAAQVANVIEEQVSGITYETVNNIRTVKVLGMSSSLLRIVSKHIEALYRSIRERIRRFRTREYALSVWGQSFRLGIFFYVASLVIKGSTQLGLLVLVYDYFGRLWRSIENISMETQKLLIAQYSVSRMQVILDEPIVIEQELDKVDFPRDWHQLRLQNVSFSYAHKPVLRNVSLSIQRGERVGIVGMSGAGKSTLFKLLLKEHEQYSGKIVIDDVSLKDIRRSSLLGHTAVVLQDTEVFNFSLQDNIRIASDQRRMNPKRLRQAAQTAHVTDFMDRLPNGFATTIGEKGVRLSGGEKQRVGLARAIYKQPEILFLDEATSHLDSESEAKIQDSLQHFFKSVTAIVIAHRLSTIRQMDTIYVLEEGRVIESGSFTELLRQKGRFAQMWDRQKF